MKKTVLLICASLLAVSATQAQSLEERFKKHLYTLASDEFAGREPGTHGDTLAANYIRDFLAGLDGVQLLANNGLQEFSYQAYRELDAAQCALKIGKRTLNYGKDYLPSLNSATGNFQGEVVNVGEGKEDDYVGKDVKGKFVLVQLTPRSYTDGAEQRTRERMALKAGAAGILMTGQPLSNLPARWPTGPIAVFKVTPQIAKMLAGKSVEGTVTVNMLTEHTFNVVAKIAAPKANNPQGDVMILGAHYDHMGVGEYEGKTKIYYGADDNASGTVGVMELARAISQRRAFLKKDVIIILFGAEERGLKGSKHYAANPVEPLDKVKVMVNIDMMGRMEGKGLTIRGIGSAYEGTDLFASLPNNDKLDLIWEFRGTGPTDYTPFYQKGIPAFSFGTRHHVDYHTPGDRADRINYEGMVMTYNYIENLINRLAFEPLNLTYRKTE